MNNLNPQTDIKANFNQYIDRYMPKESKFDFVPRHSNKWRTIIRDGMPEYICEHGIGHRPGVHGCDGCCMHANYPGPKKKK